MPAYRLVLLPLTLALALVPPPVLASSNDEVVRCMNDPDLAARWKGLGPDTPEVLRQLRSVAMRGPPCENVSAMADLHRRRGEALAKAYPEIPPARLARSDGPPYPYGYALGQAGATDKVVPALILEASYLSMTAQLLLFRAYADGLHGVLPPYDPRILALLRAMAAERLPRFELDLGTILRRGWGVAPDQAEAGRLLTEASLDLSEAKVELARLRMDQGRFGDARALLDELAQREVPEGLLKGARGELLVWAPPPIGDCAQGKAMLLEAGESLHDGEALWALARQVMRPTRCADSFEPLKERWPSFVVDAEKAGQPEAALLVSRARASSAQEGPDQWRRGCDEGRPSDCYNLGVHVAQTQGNEGRALPLYEQACEAGFSLGCFNAAGLLIKGRPTRARGLELFRKVCALPRVEGRDGVEHEDVKRLACRIAERLPAYEGLEYRDFAAKLLE